VIDDDIVVIIPARDAAGTIAAALASVAAQTLQPGSVVVIDDGSADDTAGLLRSWGDVLPLMVLENDVSRGPAVARDEAIRGQTRPIIALLDADDVWLPDHLAMLRRSFRPRTLVTADAFVWIPGEGVSRRTWRDRVAVPQQAQLAHLVQENFVFVGTMFHRDDYVSSGGFRTGGVEDWDLWIRMVANGVATVAAPGPTVLYRVTTTSRSANDAQLPAHIELLERLLAEQTDAGVRDAVERSLRVHRARLALVESYRLAALGRGADARRRARDALSGSRSVAARGLVMAVAPTAGASVQRRLKFKPSRWLR